LRRYAFVPSAASVAIAVIDTDADKIVGTVPLDFVPTQVEVSRELVCLVASDGRSPFLAVIDLQTGAAKRIALPGPANRITLGTSGWLAAVSDLGAGAVSIVDLVKCRVKGTVAQLGAVRDVLFVDQDASLYVAAADESALHVIDVNQVALAGRIPGAGPPGRGVIALARLPNGCRGFALPQGGGPITVLDFEEGTAGAAIDAGPEPAGIYPSGTGAAVFVPDAREPRLAVLRGEGSEPAHFLPAEPGLGPVYSLWLDSVALAPSAARRQVLVYDLDAMQAAGSIALPGQPSRGAVTPDSRKLYLPLTDTRQVLVLDGATRRVLTAIVTPDPPAAVIVPGGSGICH
jgi:DNA-binding beta-propeller fold protein YncE